MKASLTISSNGNFTVRLFPETDAEREILRRVGECKELTSADRLRTRGYASDLDQLEIMPMPKVKNETPKT